MKSWILYDQTEPVEDEAQFPRTAIGSAQELRDQLQHWARRKPGTALLESPEGDYLEMWLGGPWAGVAWTKPPASIHNASALANTPCTTAPVQFRDQGMPTHHRVEDLFPVDEVIDIVLHYYQTQQLACWIPWRVWNANTNTWDTRPATETAPRSPVLSR